MTTENIINPHEYIEALIDSCDGVVTFGDIKRISKEIHTRGLKTALVEVHDENMSCGSGYHAHVTRALVDQVTKIENE